MVKLVGAVAVLLGLAIMAFARQSEGLGGALLFLMGLALAVMGGYLMFFEDGQGAARWLDFLQV